VQKNYNLYYVNWELRNEKDRVTSFGGNAIIAGDKEEARKIHTERKLERGAKITDIKLKESCIQTADTRVDNLTEANVQAHSLSPAPSDIADSVTPKEAR
jgi:hypothetical protein